MRDTCAICGVVFDEDKGVIISRCCCSSDYICPNCVSTKSLADYIAKAV